MYFTPKTRLGKLSIITILLFFLFLVIMMIIAKVQGPRDDQTFLDNLWLFVPVALMVISGISSLSAGLISMISKGERSFLVYLSTFIGLILLWFLIGEMLS